jgi:hypothetical protein
MLCARHMSLVKPFEALEPRGGFVGSEGLEARGLEIVDDAGDQRSFRPTTTKSTLFALQNVTTAA